MAACLRPLPESATCNFETGTCGWRSNPAVDAHGFAHSKSTTFQMFTDLHSPTPSSLRLAFMYQLVPTNTQFQFSLQYLTASPSWGSVESFSWVVPWTGASAGDWRKVKLTLPANIVLALKFESVDAEVSIDNVHLTQPASIAPIPYARITTSYHTCVLHVSVGQIRCWGNGYYGQLGQGNTDDIGDGSGEMGDSLKAVELGSGRTAKQVAAGDFHTCALLDDESIKCWGNGYYGQLGQGNTDHIGDGSGEMGDSLKAVELGSDRTAKQVAAGRCHTCALLDDESIKCWGNGYYGQLGQGNTDDIGDGSGEMGDSLKAVELGSNRTAKQVAAGRYHTCALLDDESIKCWGNGYYGQLGQGNTDHIGDGSGEMGDSLKAVELGSGRTAKQVAAGDYHTCALLDDESIKCWGRGDYGRLGQGNTDDIGDGSGEMGDSLKAVDVGTDRNAQQVAAGFYHTCALLDDESIKCWGRGEYAQLGQGNTDDIGDGSGEMGDSLKAVELGSDRTAKSLSVGSHHACALLDDDSIKCWGSGYYGQLGLGNVERIGDEQSEMGDYLPRVDVGTIPTTIKTEIRLVDGTMMKGRIQVKYQESWRDVCEDNWNNLNAQVVCRQLGLAGGLSSFGWNGSGEFGMDQVACVGSEPDLGQCPFRGWGIHDCGSWEAVGVECHLDAWSFLADPDLSARRGHSAVWDATDASMLVFAGHEAGSFRYYDDLWRYHNGLWEQLLVAGGPSSRGGHTAIWHMGSRTMIVFGGSHYTTYYSELWLYSLSTNAWRLSNSSTMPTARAYHSAIWDLANQIMLIFAGENGIPMADLWEYRFLSNDWRELTPSSGKPSARSRHSAVWAGAMNAMLIFGGWASTALDDVWLYGWWTNAWTLLSPANPPSGRAGYSAIWDPLTFSMLTCGGVKVLNESFSYTAELWNYSLLTNAWTPLAPPGTYPSPSAREDHTAVWDPDLRFMYILGGFDVSYKKDFWRYAGYGVKELAVEECFVGQECTVKLPNRSFETGDTLTVVDFFTGSSDLGFSSSVHLTTLDGYSFSFASEDSQDLSAMSDVTLYLYAQPGPYRLRWCPLNSDCAGHAGQWLEVGLLVVVGPFGGQSLVCDLGASCVVTTLQGSRLSKSDQLLPMKECGTSLQTAILPVQPINASNRSWDLQFDLGYLELDGFAPESVQLCWCSEESGCREPADFRALAMVLYVVCPAGLLETGV